MPKVPSQKKKVKRSAAFKRRSVAAKKGWEKRRAQDLELPVKGSAYTLREHLLGTASRLHGRNSKDRSILEDMVLDEDKRWLDFQFYAMGLFKATPHSIRNAWFSPKPQKVVMKTT